MGYDTETEICILNKKDVTMSRGKKDREEITNTEEVKETEVSDEMEKAEDSEKAEDDKKPEETKETDDKPVSLYVQEPFIDPSVYRQRRKKRIIRTVTIAVVATLLAVYIGGVIFHMHRFGVNTTINGRNVAGKSVQSAFGCTEIHTGYQVQGQ